MFDEDELTTAEGGARQRSRTVKRAIIVALTVALVVGLLVVVRANGGGTDLTADSRPSDDPVVCDPLASEQPYCVHKPDPTSTTIETTIPSVTTPPTSLPPPTVPPAPQPLHLEGSDDTLRVSADLDTANPAAGQVIRVDMKIRERGRRTYSGIDFGDGATYGMPSTPRGSCVWRDPATTTTQAPEHESTQTEQHSYRVPGKYQITILVVSSDCTDDSEVQLTGMIVVGPGVSLSNGLLPPVVGAWQLHTSPAPNAVDLNVHIRDLDGFLTGVTIKWGDGSTETKQYPLGDCIDPKTRWPGPTSDTLVLRHTFGSSGAYEVEVVATSSGCAGGDAQSATKRVTVTAVT